MCLREKKILFLRLFKNNINPDKKIYFLNLFLNIINYLLFVKMSLYNKYKFKSYLLLTNIYCNSYILFIFFKYFLSKDNHFPFYL